jgi:aryl-alcohol dehydrogenase-like predicted oxidoreductase
VASFTSTDLLGDQAGWNIRHRHLSNTIVGATSINHPRSNVAIAEKGPLPTDLYEEAKRRLDVASW